MVSCTESSSDTSKANTDWPVYGGNLAGNRYSPLDEITKDNVNTLEISWIYDARSTSEPEERLNKIECHPLMINGILYGAGTKSQLFALDAATGKELWKFTPPNRSTNRGLNYWQDENGGTKRILYVAGPDLYAIDAETGKPIKTFGENGKVDFHVGLENDRFDVRKYSITATSPGVIYENVLVMGSTVSERGDGLPGSIRGFDVRTGKLLWVFNTVPLPGEYGYDTWPEDAYKKIGGANNWAGMVLDEKRATVYLGTGSPSFDFYGGDRKGKNLFANCILALDAITGELNWHYQVIHHDLWDLDIACPPNLLTIEHNGKNVDVLVQTTKEGLVYVLNRDTGESVFPVEDRPVPLVGLPGEHPFPTQKFPLKPEPLVTRQILTEADLPDSLLFPESYKKLKKQFLSSRHGSKYIPHSKEGFWYIGTGGGANWGGNATDPDGVLYQNVNEVPTNIQLANVSEKLKESVSYGNTLYINNCAACHGIDRKGNSADIPALLDFGDRLTKSSFEDILKNGSGRMPSFRHLPKEDRDAISTYVFDRDKQAVPVDDVHASSDQKLTTVQGHDFPYVPIYTPVVYTKVYDDQGYPGIKPPWGTLNALDLNTGEYLWRVPLGEYEELTKRGIPVTGTPNLGGPIVTAGGLVFIGATQDAKIRAFDKKTGEMIWEHPLPGNGKATPITYEIDGKQFVVIATSDSNNRVQGIKKEKGGMYVAFSLP
ncbi:PQQ-binding-like beta-propeller repeat protein [Pricia sp.]|uniref:outer membrane protein assembly factor BamB family protein n=1 Tax=Pricia sp. TaxID=2268138 RepID=UPI00359452D4